MSKQKFEMEFPLRSSNKVLYNSLSTPDGLSEWFADDVNIKNGVFIFKWDGSEERAKLIAKKPYESVKFQWERDDEADNTTFEFNIKTDSITNEVALIVTDFANEEDMEESKFLWNNQIGTLKQKLGA